MEAVRWRNRACRASNFKLTFPSAVMDGIDLDIEGGNKKNYGVFIEELRTLMDNDPSKGYLITGAPQCPFPDHFLGPGPGTGKYQELRLALETR